MFLESLYSFSSSHPTISQTICAAGFLGAVEAVAFISVIFSRVADRFNTPSSHHRARVIGITSTALSALLAETGGSAFYYPALLGLFAGLTITSFSFSRPRSIYDENGFSIYDRNLYPVHLPFTQTEVALDAPTLSRLISSGSSYEESVRDLLENEDNRAAPAA